MQGIENLEISWSFVSTKLSFYVPDWNKPKIDKLIIDLRHCSDNHNYLNPKQNAYLIYPLLINKSMALNPSNIIVSRTGTTSETIFHL